MQEGTIPRRWARALADVVVEAEGATALARVEDELSAVAKALDQPDMKQAMFNPAFALADRARILEEIAVTNRMHDVVRKFFALIVEKDRVRYLQGIARAFAGEVDGRTGRVRAEITSAKKLDDAALNEILAALKHKTGKDVVADFKIDPSVLSGIRTKIGGVVYDGTVRARLERLRQEIT